MVPFGFVGVHNTGHRGESSAPTASSRVQPATDPRSLMAVGLNCPGTLAPEVNTNTSNAAGILANGTSVPPRDMNGRTTLSSAAKLE